MDLTIRVAPVQRIGRPAMWAAGLLLAGAVNAVMLALLFTHLSQIVGFADWRQLAELDPQQPYASGFYRWAPVALPLWQALVVPLGFWLWGALHLAALAIPRDWRFAALALATFPFWFDLFNGAALTFVVVLAWCAIRGSRAATLAYVALFALMPRPLMAPVLLWLLWKRRDARWAAAVAALAVLASSVAMGQLEPWVGRLLTTGPSESASLWNTAPWAPLGLLWLPIGLALAAWLTYRGRLGLASLCASPYLLPYYWLMGALELRSR